MAKVISSPVARVLLFDRLNFFLDKWRPRCSIDIRLPARNAGRSALAAPSRAAQTDTHLPGTAARREPNRVVHARIR